jgi:hypothetical protein
MGSKGVEFLTPKNFHESVVARKGPSEKYRECAITVREMSWDLKTL